MLSLKFPLSQVNIRTLIAACKERLRLTASIAPAGDFVIDSETCPDSLPADADCTISVRYESSALATAAVINLRGWPSRLIMKEQDEVSIEKMPKQNRCRQFKPYIRPLDTLWATVTPDKQDEVLNQLTPNLPLERHFRDVRAGSMQPPGGDTALEIIGRAAVEQPSPKLSRSF